MAKLHKLGEVLPPAMFETTYKALEDYFDKPIVVHGATVCNGKYGAYDRCVCSETEDGPQFYLACGATQPMEALKYLTENRAFPVELVFRKLGKAVIITDPDEPEPAAATGSEAGTLPKGEEPPAEGKGKNK